MIETVKTTTTTNGDAISILSSPNGQYFANGKKYWIQIGAVSGRRAVSSSDSLTYITKKFEEIVERISK
tara:strand:+ start:733 stop:939 length:207 start_codon:yes stop_codon:yes gene_type:complete